MLKYVSAIYYHKNYTEISLYMLNCHIERSNEVAKSKYLSFNGRPIRFAQGDKYPNYTNSTSKDNPEII